IDHLFSIAWDRVLVDGRPLVADEALIERVQEGDRSQEHRLSRTGWSRNRQSVTRIDVEARTTNQPAVAWDPAAETACPDERGCLRDGVRRPIRGTGSRVGWTHILDGHARSHRAPVPVFREAPGRIPLELLVWGHGDYPPRRHPTSPAPRMTSG